jgi:hypothetical protein
MKKLLIAAVAFALSACGTVGTLPAGLPTSPAAVADKTVLDEKAGIAVETMYTAVTRAGALAFRSGLVKPSTNAAVQRDDFCPRVLARLFEPTDRGSAVMAVECKLRVARDATRRAYDAGNASGYDVAAREAIALGRELLALIRGE